MRTIHLGPEDLVEARLRADRAAGDAGATPSSRCSASTPRRPSTRARRRRAAPGRRARRVRADRARPGGAAVAWKRAGLRSMRPRSKPAVAIATFQPWFSSPRRFSRGTRASSKNTSAKPVSPSSCAIGRTRHARRGERDEDEGETAVALGARIGAEDAEDPVGERRARAPRLLAVQHVVSRRRAVAVARMAAMSLPAFGSDHPCAQISSPHAMRGR